MKLKSLAILLTLALFTVACNRETPRQQSNEPATTTSQSSPRTPGGASNFVGVGHNTEGSARIVTEGSQRYLVLDEAFKSDNGPDLYVVLHRANPPRDYNQSDYVNLGRLQNTSGTQKYSIPADVNPKDFRSVVIWCQKFNVTFGYAPL
ncbi:MAG: DM13 domain-containing protein [Cyanosarcina radialis HA8281-LM2]|jgi:hypothetical protein|nr:DM13 domain-containing protein [Cyanosarcina radialis HA8281-LM2]